MLQGLDTLALTGGSHSDTCVRPSLFNPQRCKPLIKTLYASLPFLEVGGPQVVITEGTVASRARAN